jgi:penicillin amidase
MRRLVLLCALSLGACAGEDAPNGGGGGADAGADAEVGATEVDAGLDAAPDATLDAGADDADGPVDAADATAADDGGAPDSGPPERELTITGLAEPVEVRFDAQQVLHVRAASEEDAFVAQGYFHAAHRFGQMDFSRRAARGDLTELYRLIGFGNQTFAQDVQARRVHATRSGRPLWDVLLEAASPRTRSYLEAYTRGVNAWIADRAAGRNGARITDDWQVFSGSIEAWTVEDTVATVLLLVEALTNSVDNDIAFARGAARLSAAEVLDLFTLIPAASAVIDPDVTPSRAREAPDAPALAALKRHQAWLRGRTAGLDAVAAKLGPPPDRAIGSNNWVLRASETADGTTLLANDPHLPMTNPALWYVVDIAGGDLHVAGLSFPGFPGILIGQNEDIAWGTTTTVLDQADAYLEEVVVEAGEPVGVRFRGETVPFVVDVETFTDPSGQPVTQELLYVPHHGPVLDLDLGRQIATTLRWAAQDMGTDVEVFPDLWSASSIDDARAALEGATALGQNFVVMDDADNVGWFPYNAVPSRPWASLEAPPWSALDGASGDFEWGAYLPLSQLPQAQNPTRGWIATANNDMTGNLRDGDPTDDGTPYWQGPVAAGYRAQRIAAVLASGAGSHDADAMRALQADVHSAFGEATVPALLDVLGATPVGLDDRGARVRDALADWDFGCPTGVDGADPAGPATTDVAEARASRGCLAFHVVWARLLHGVFGDELQRAGWPRSNPRDEALVLQLTDPGALAGGPYWDDVGTAEVEGAAEIVVRALNAAGDALTEELGADPDAWRWGRWHTVSLQPPDGRPLVEGPFANDGGWYTVDVAGPSVARFRLGRSPDGFTTDFSHGSGPSTRLVCALASGEPARPPACTLSLPGRQRAFDDVTEEADLMRRHWLPNAPFPLRFNDDEVDAATMEIVRLRASE